MGLWRQNYETTNKQTNKQTIFNIMNGEAVPAVDPAGEEGSEPLVKCVETFNDKIQCGDVFGFPHLRRLLE